MSEQHPEIQDPTALIVVAETTIEQFSHEEHDLQDMYRELYEHNPNLALYLRRRASEVSPDLNEREVLAKLALELVSILAKQQGAAGLEALYSLELVEEDSAVDVPEARQPPP